MKKISLIFLSLILFVFGFFILNDRFATINSVKAENSIPYDYVYFSNWNLHTETNIQFNSTGVYFWGDGTNIYYSNGSTHYVLDTTTFTWSVKTWYGRSSLNAENIWSDGVNIYYSDSVLQYVLDIPTSTWNVKTWNGLSSFNGLLIWSDGSNFYTRSGSNHYILDTTTSTWNVKTWYVDGVTLPNNFNGDYVWTDGSNIYYSYNTAQLVLDTTTSTWSSKTWSGLSSFVGNDVWTDGINVYYNNEVYGSYVLDTATSTWSAKTWTGINVNFAGRRIYSDPSLAIVLLNSSGYDWYSLDREEIVPPDPPDIDGTYIDGYIDGYYDAYNDALNSGYDTGYNIGYNNGLNYATNMLSGYGPFLYSTWSIVDINDYSIIRGDLTGRFTTEYFDKYNGGFINNVDFVNLVFDYEENNPDDDNAMKIDFDNYLPLSKYNNVVTFNFLYGNEIYFILDNGTTLYFDNDSITKSISFDTYSNNSIVSIVITFASSISDYGYFGLGFNSNYLVSYNNGFNDGYDKGHSEGNSNGFSLGKNIGYQQGLAAANKYTFFGLISAVVDAPLNAFTSLLNFNILGVNILNLLTGLLTLLFVLVVVKLFLGR